MIFEIVDDSYSEQLYNAEKKAKSDKIIDEAMEFWESIRTKIHAAKSKKDYPAIHKEIEEKEDYFIGELTSL